MQFVILKVVILRSTASTNGHQKWHLIHQQKLFHLHKSLKLKVSENSNAPYEQFLRRFIKVDARAVGDRLTQHEARIRFNKEAGQY